MVECWLRVWEVLDSIPSQGVRHTKEVLKMVPTVLLLALIIKMEILALSQELR